VHFVGYLYIINNLSPLYGNFTIAHLQKATFLEYVLQQLFCVSSVVMVYSINSHIILPLSSMGVKIGR